MDTSIFKYGELPEFKKFTPENINKQFPQVLKKITEDFNNIEKNLSNYLKKNDLNWDKVINPIIEVNEILRWSWGVISHLNAVNNSENLRDIYSKFLPEIISLSNKFGQSKIIYNSLVKLKERNNFDQIKKRILDKEIINKVKEKIKSELLNHKPINALVHGDLWSGNAGIDKNGKGVIFDPASWWADNEVDIAMTKLFGGFRKEFYEEYHRIFPIKKGFEKRVIIYNFYHILNHANMFGGGYLKQVEDYVKAILNM